MNNILFWNIDFSQLMITSTWASTPKPTQQSFTPTSSTQRIKTTPTSTIINDTTSVQLISSTQQHFSTEDSTEEENTISEASQHDSNSILDESEKKPKRYTISAAKSAGIPLKFKNKN